MITGAASYTYTVQEGDADHQLRVVVTYKDRRGEDKMATSAPTDVVTMDPRANVPPRLRSGVFTTSEGPAIIDFGFLDATDRDGDNITFAMLEQQDYALFELSETRTVCEPSRPWTSRMAARSASRSPCRTAKGWTRTATSSTTTRLMSPPASPSSCLTWKRRASSRSPRWSRRPERRRLQPLRMTTAG